MFSINPLIANYFPKIKLTFYGLALTLLISMLSLYLSTFPLMKQYGLSALTLAILLGIVVGNTLYSKMIGRCGQGVQFSKQYLLRAGIILYGFNLTFQDIATIGLSSIIVDLVIISSTFTLACWAGKHLFRIDAQTTMLIGAGASICGAAAVMATEPVVKADSNKLAVAVSTVVIFGTIAMFLYPWLYELNEQYQWWIVSQQNFGIYTGSTIHEVAQVVAAGHSIGEEASNTAVITKMIRVMMLAPFLLFLSYYINRKDRQSNGQKYSIWQKIPWFAVWFIIIAGLNSLHILPQSTVTVLLDIDRVFLAMAMAALGLTTHISAIKQAGLKPILLALFLFFWLIFGGGMINHFIQMLFI